MKFDVVQLDPNNPEHHTAVAYIKNCLRPEELYELSAVGAKPDDMLSFVAMGAALGEVWLICWHGEPVFVWGVFSTVQGVYGLFGFGTKDTRRAMPAITRWGMNTWLPDFLARTNARRIEVRVPTSSVHSIRWLMKLGMRDECVLHNYSVVGEPFIQLAFTPKASDVHTSPIRYQNPKTATGNSSTHQNECGHSS